MVNISYSRCHRHGACAKPSTGLYLPSTAQVLPPNGAPVLRHLTNTNGHLSHPLLMELRPTTTPWLVHLIDDYEGVGEVAVGSDYVVDLAHVVVGLYQDGQQCTTAHTQQTHNPTDALNFSLLELSALPRRSVWQHR